MTTAVLRLSICHDESSLALIDTVNSLCAPRMIARARDAQLLTHSALVESSLNSAPLLWRQFFVRHPSTPHGLVV